MPKPFTVIIMLNYNGAKDTVECLESLKKTNYDNFKILIIDNASQDNSVEVFRERFPELELVVTEKNLGYTGGINRGFISKIRSIPSIKAIPCSGTPTDFNMIINMIIPTPGTGAVPMDAKTAMKTTVIC